MIAQDKPHIASWFQMKLLLRDIFVLLNYEWKSKTTIDLNL
jgi:hypothetical protein